MLDRTTLLIETRRVPTSQTTNGISKKDNSDSVRTTKAGGWGNERLKRQVVRRFLKQSVTSQTWLSAAECSTAG